MQIRFNKLGQKGFTLVEVIVVAVIVAILAGVSIPLYNGYVNSSRANQAANAAGSVASFLGACYQAKGTPQKLAATGESDSLTITCNLPGGDSSSVVVPEGYIVTRTNNTITAKHDDPDAKDSQPFAFSP